MKRKEKTKLIMLVLILPILLINIISAYAVTELLGSEVSYDRSTSKLRATNVDDAIDELYEKIQNMPQDECPKGYECNIIPTITYDANGGKFDNNEETNKVIYSRKISKTPNVDIDGNKVAAYRTTSSGNTDTVKIDGADSLEVYIKYQTSSSSAYAAVFDASVSPSTSNVDSSSMSGRLYGTTIATKTYTIEGDTIKFFWYGGTSLQYNDYLGYYAKVSAILPENGEYKIPTKQGYIFKGWNTKKDGSGNTYKTKSQINEILGNNTNMTLYAQWGDYICKKASSLHTSTCTYSNGNGCNSVGYSNGDTITYGQIGTSGTLESGDAFDCDVNGDGTYDSDSERFYYVSDYYDTSNKNFDSNVAVLIYSGNPSGSYYYKNGTSSTNYNYYGPKTAYSILPTTSSWKNVSLYKTNRQILTETGTTSTSGGTLPVFGYGDKAARLLTTQELVNGCNTTVDNATKGQLADCYYIFENMGGSNFWLETPYASNSASAYIVYYGSSNLASDTVTSYNYVRPVIEVLKSEIDY